MIGILVGEDVFLSLVHRQQGFFDQLQILKNGVNFTFQAQILAPILNFMSKFWRQL